MLARVMMRAGALANGITYVHTPFQALDHVGGQEAAMEAFVNLGADEIDIRQVHPILNEQTCLRGLKGIVDTVSASKSRLKQRSLTATFGSTEEWRHLLSL